MVDAKRIFVFVLFGMFLVSMMGVVVATHETYNQGAADAAAGVERDPTMVYDNDYDDGYTETLMNAENTVFVGIKGFFASFPGEGLKFTSISEGVNDYKGWLYAILLGMIVYTIISSFFSDSSKYIKWGISIAITAIAMIGIPSELYNALEVQYGAMGSTILAMIPFVILLLFTLKVGSLGIARMTWVIFTLYSLAMFWARYLAAAPGSKWPYVLGFFVALVMIWSIGFWRETFFHGELASQTEKAAQRAEARAVNRKLEEDDAKSKGIGVGSRK